jgi:hypothetical protein
VLGQNGAPFSQFELENCQPLRSDNTCHQVTWKRRNDLASLQGRLVTFRFHATNARFYSFWVSPDEFGASNGYVGAGGPGFTGSIDTVGSKRI